MILSFGYIAHAKHRQDFYAFIQYPAKMTWQNLDVDGAHSSQSRLRTFYNIQTCPKFFEEALRLHKKMDLGKTFNTIVSEIMFRPDLMNPWNMIIFLN